MIKPIKPDMDSLVFTTGETLWYLKITYPTLKKIIKEGEIIPSRVGKRYRFLRSELDRYLTKPRIGIEKYLRRFSHEVI